LSAAERKYRFPSTGVDIHTEAPYQAVSDILF